MLRAVLGILLMLKLVATIETLYRPEQEITLIVHDLDSRKTHLRFAYSYIPLCPIKRQYDLLTQQLPYNIKIMESVTCRQACTVHLSEQDVQRYRWMINHSYEEFYSLSPSMPALYKNTNPQSEKLVSYDLGFPIGWQHDKTSYQINNQIELVFYYRKVNDSIEILNLIITQANCTKDKFFLESNSSEITYYYSVTWKQEKEKLQVQPDLSTSERVRWIAIGFVVNIAYCFVIASILYRSLLRDLRNCARQIMGGTVQEFMELSEERSLGWKQHQREVFRPPRHKFVLSALFGAGVQAMLVIFLTLGRMAIKNYHYFEFEDSNILLWWRSLLIVTSVMGGYSATRVYKMWGGQNWMANSLVTSLILPITLTLSLSIENSMRLLENALSYSIFEMFYLPVLWLAAAIPLGMIGSAYGYKRKAIKNPFNFHAVQQKRSYQFNTSKQMTMGFIASLVPYLSFAAEYRVLLDSFWLSNPYDLYALLFVAIILLIISSGLASLFTTYQSLNKGNPKWWGIPFVIAGGLAICFVTAQTLYLIIEINITRLTSIIIYFCWSFISVWMIFLFIGASSFIFTTLMVRKIYEMIKLD